jgi:integrase
MRSEIQQLFDFLDAVIDDESTSPYDMLCAYRDVTLYRTTYAYGPRRKEVAFLRGRHFSRNAHAPEFGNFGSMTIENGKSKPFGPERLRVVHTSHLMEWIVPELERYVHEVRPLFPVAEFNKALFLTNRGRIGLNTVSKRFAHWRELASLDPILTLHSLRRSFATHHIEMGYDMAAISKQLGHDWETSTARYTYLSEKFVRLAIEEARRFLDGDADV